MVSLFSLSLSFSLFSEAHSCAFSVKKASMSYDPTKLGLGRGKRRERKKTGMPSLSKFSVSSFSSLLFLSLCRRKKNFFSSSANLVQSKHGFFLHRWSELFHVINYSNHFPSLNLSLSFSPFISSLKVSQVRAQKEYTLVIISPVLPT